MPTSKLSPNGDALVDLTLEIYRLSGVLVAEGDRLSAQLGLSAARWKVLGALAVSDRALTVSQIARRMGLTRQSVQRLVSELCSAGYLDLIDNPDHRTARLARLTKKGVEAFEALDEIEAEWANQLAEGIAVSELRAAASVLGNVRQRIDGLNAFTEIGITPLSRSRFARWT